LYTIVLLRLGELSVIIGCSGWSYSDSFEAGGWVKLFYPDSQTKKLQYYAQFFDTAEMDATFYKKFYTYMTKDTFVVLNKATPDKFQFSVKVPETVTHENRLDVNRGAITFLDEFLEKISPLEYANKLGAVLIQLPPSFTVKEFQNTEAFLDRLPNGYDYAIEFRHPSWNTEGPWEMLKHYNIAAVMTDSPESDKLKFLAEPIVTASHAFIRWHGRQVKPRYNYLYSREELEPWAEKIKEIATETSIVRGYFNNHYGARAVVNAVEFKEMLGNSLSEKEKAVVENARNYFYETVRQATLDDTLKGN
jgi:uncharacterized protein YecE (DUF72 family)